jgi:hypothetical protein
VSICLIDTSILCEILEVPKLCRDPKAVLSELEAKLRRGESFLLPMSSIIETGNHIGQVGDGRQRRATAEKFVLRMQQAIRGEAPFAPTPFFEPDAVLAWLSEFPDWAARGSGLADLTILKEFEKQCGLNRHRRVYIWTTDRHLSAYDRRP